GRGRRRCLRVLLRRRPRLLLRRLRLVPELVVGRRLVDRALHRAGGRRGRRRRGRGLLPRPLTVGRPGVASTLGRLLLLPDRDRPRPVVIGAHIVGGEVVVGGRRGRHRLLGDRLLAQVGHPALVGLGPRRRRRRDRRRRDLGRALR